MRFGIFSKTFETPTLEENFAAVQAHGLDVVQFNMVCAGLPSMPDEIPHGLARRIRTAAAATGVQIAAISGTYNMIHPDVKVRQAGQRRLRVLAAACAEIGTQVITLCTGTRDPQDMWRHHPDNASAEAWADLLAEMEQALATAAGFGLTLAIEPEHANVISSSHRARALLDALGAEHLKVVLDGANLIFPGCEQARVLAEAFDLLGAHTILAHAKDISAEGAFVAAGRGVLDYPCYLGLMRSAGFDGPLVLHGLAAREVAGSLAGLRAQAQAIF